MQKLFENWRAFISERKGEAEEDMIVIPGERGVDVGYGDKDVELYVNPEPTEISPSHGTKVKLAVQAAKAAAAKAEKERIKKIKDYAPEAVRQLANNIKAQRNMPKEKRGVGVIIPCYAGDCPDQMIANNHSPFWNANKVRDQFKEAYPGNDKDSKELRKEMLSLLTTDAPGIFGQYKSNPAGHYMYFGISGGKGRKEQRGVGTKITPEMIVVHSSTTKNPYRTVSALGGRAASRGLGHLDKEELEGGPYKKRAGLAGGTDLKGAGHTLSTNFEIDHDGTIYEYFPAGTKTVHAGWANNYSVGIDLTGKQESHTDAQIASLEVLIELIRNEFPSIPTGVAPQISDGQFWSKYGGRTAIKRLRKIPFDKRYGVFPHTATAVKGDRSDPGNRVMTGIGAEIPSGELLTYLVMNDIAPKAGQGVSAESLKAATLDARARKKMQRKADRRARAKRRRRGTGT